MTARATGGTCAKAFLGVPGMEHRQNEEQTGNAAKKLGPARSPSLAHELLRRALDGRTVDHWV